MKRILLFLLSLASLTAFSQVSTTTTNGFHIGVNGNLTRGGAGYVHLWSPSANVLKIQYGAGNIFTLPDSVAMLGKQAILVSGINIKNVGGTSLLGSGNIPVGTGTVTSVTSADGNITVATGTTTPVLTSVSAPKWQTSRSISATGDITWTVNTDGSANATASATVTKLNGTSLAGLSTGLLKITTSTGVPSTAVVGTDYAAPTSGSSILYGNGAGGFSSVTVGSGLTFTGGTLTAPSGSGVTTATASTIAGRDANANLTANSFISSTTSTATEAGTTTLTVSSTHYQDFTGTTTQTIVMPVASTMGPGRFFEISNTSTGALTINSSGGNLIVTMVMGSKLMIRSLLQSGTTAASWDFKYSPPNPVTATGDLVVGTGSATIGKLAVGSTNQLLSVSSGTPAWVTGVPGTTTNDNAATGFIGEDFVGTQSTYTNYTTTATYQNVASVVLPSGGDYDVSIFGTFSTNSATLTTTANAIFTFSTATASATGSTEGINIAYLNQGLLTATTAKLSVGIPTFRLSITSGATYYLNSQSTFTLGNPQFVGTIHIRRVR